MATSCFKSQAWTPGAGLSLSQDLVELLLHLTGRRFEKAKQFEPTERRFLVLYWTGPA
jgi:hypothetical protein